MKDLHYINVGIATTEVYGIDLSRVDTEIALSLNSKLGLSTTPQPVPEVADRFYDLIHILYQNISKVKFLHTGDVIRLLVRDQVPYTPEEFESILALIGKYTKFVEWELAGCYQIFLGKSLFKLAHLITEGYRTFDISVISLETLKDDSPLEFTCDDLGAYASLSYYFDEVGDDIKKLIQKPKTRHTYGEFVWMVFENLIKDQSPYSLGEAISDGSLSSSAKSALKSLPKK